MSYNKYGLSREIPKEIKLKVRRNSGFGCVICGLGIYEYDHIDPEFKDAQEHDPNNITLLCSQCHSKKTRKFLNKETILERMKNPISFSKGYTNEYFDINLENHIKIQIGNAVFTNCNIPIRINNKDLIRIDKPIDGSSFYNLSCEFIDYTGLKKLKIVNNEWRASSDNWDIITKAGELIIMNEGETYLIIKNKNNNTLFIKYFKSVINNYDIEMSEEGLKINNQKYTLLNVENCLVGMNLG